MKKTETKTKRLQLNVETLRALENKQLEGVAGAGTHHCYSPCKACLTTI